MATASHGSSMKYGSLSSQVRRDCETVHPGRAEGCPAQLRQKRCGLVAWPQCVVGARLHSLPSSPTLPTPLPLITRSLPHLCSLRMVPAVSPPHPHPSLTPQLVLLPDVQLRGLKIVLANGTLLEITPQSNPHLFNAAGADGQRMSRRSRQGGGVGEGSRETWLECALAPHKKLHKTYPYTHPAQAWALGAWGSSLRCGLAALQGRTRGGLMRASG